MNEWIEIGLTIVVILAAWLLLTVVLRIYDKQDSLIEQIKAAKQLKDAAEALIEKLSKREITVWIARDKSGALYLFFAKPVKWEDSFIWLDPNNDTANNIRLSDDIWPEVKWEDKEPLELRFPIEYSSTESCSTKKR
jgi:hypothetical protein